MFIVLATYQKLDKDTDIVIDNSQNMNELIMLIQRILIGLKLHILLWSLKMSVGRYGDGLGEMCCAKSKRGCANNRQSLSCINITFGGKTKISMFLFNIFN